MGSNGPAEDSSSDWPQTESVLRTPFQTDTVWADLDLADLVHWTLVSLDGRASMQIRRRFVVGSGLCCNLCLAEDGIATHHAMLNFEDGRVYVTPLSEAVTMVDGQKIEGRHQLRPDVTLTFGSASFRLRSDLPESAGIRDPLTGHRIPKRQTQRGSRVVRGLRKAASKLAAPIVEVAPPSDIPNEPPVAARPAAVKPAKARPAAVRPAAVRVVPPWPDAPRPQSVRSITPPPDVVVPSTPSPAVIRSVTLPPRTAPRPVTPRRTVPRAKPYLRVLITLLALSIALWLIPTNLHSPEKRSDATAVETSAPTAVAPASSLPSIADAAATDVAPAASADATSSNAPSNKTTSNSAGVPAALEPAARHAVASPAVRQADGVAALMQEAASLEARGSVYAPAGRNAVTKYVRVLELAPNTIDARDRLSKIVGGVTQHASELILSQRFEQARQLLGRLSTAIPRNRSTLIDARALNDWRALDLVLQADTLMQNYRLAAPDEPNAVAVLREALRIDPNNVIAEELLAKSFGMLAGMQKR